MARNRFSPIVGTSHWSSLYSLIKPSRILSIFILSRNLVTTLLTLSLFQKPSPSFAPFAKSSWLKNLTMVPTSFNCAALYVSSLHVFDVWSTKNLISKGQISAWIEHVFPSEPNDWPQGQIHLWFPSPRSRHSCEQPPLFVAQGDWTYSFNQGSC